MVKFYNFVINFLNNPFNLGNSTIVKIETAWYSAQGGPLPVVNGVKTPISRLPIYKSIDRNYFTLFVTGSLAQLLGICLGNFSKYLKQI